VAPARQRARSHTRARCFRREQRAAGLTGLPVVLVVCDLPVHSDADEARHQQQQPGDRQGGPRNHVALDLRGRQARLLPRAAPRRPVRARRRPGKQAQAKQCCARAEGRPTLTAKTKDTTDAVPHQMPAAEDRPSLSTANSVFAMDSTKKAPEMRPSAVNTCAARPGLSGQELPTVIAAASASKGCPGARSSLGCPGRFAGARARPEGRTRGCTARSGRDDSTMPRHNHMLKIGGGTCADTLRARCARQSTVACTHAEHAATQATQTGQGALVDSAQGRT